jgi:hypothetical protein
VEGPVLLNSCTLLSPRPHPLLGGQSDEPDHPPAGPQRFEWDRPAGAGHSAQSADCRPLVQQLRRGAPSRAHERDEFQQPDCKYSQSLLVQKAVCSVERFGFSFRKLHITSQLGDMYHGSCAGCCMKINQCPICNNAHSMGAWAPVQTRPEMYWLSNKVFLLNLCFRTCLLVVVYLWRPGNIMNKSALSPSCRHLLSSPLLLL